MIFGADADFSKINFDAVALNENLNILSFLFLNI